MTAASLFLFLPNVSTYETVNQLINQSISLIASDRHGPYQQSTGEEHAIQWKSKEEHKETKYYVKYTQEKSQPQCSCGGAVHIDYLFLYLY